MSSISLSLLWFVVAISVLVAIHEYGHYIVGRWCGMKVLRFSIGFGRPLWSWRGKAPDRTEFCVAAIPLGGYVKFLDEREQAVAAADSGRAFQHRPVPQRIAVLLAGPLFNFLFAIAAYWLLFVNGVPALKPAVGQVETGSFAAEAGLRHGDRILSVGDREATDWESALVAMIDEMVRDGRIPMRVAAADGASRAVVIDVGTDTARLTEPGLLFDGLGFAPWQPPAIIGEVAPDGAAAGSELRAGDLITRIDGEPVNSFTDLSRIVSVRPGETVTVEYRRDGRRDSTDITIGDVEQADGGRRGMLGVSVVSDFGDMRYVRQYGALAAIPQSLSQTWDTMAFTVRMLGRMLTGDVSIKNISGPISIAQYAGDSAAAGFDRFLKFLALISISLGVLNLLPVPILDGGQIVYQLIEAFKGSPLSERSQLIGQQFGILVLLVLMSFAFYNDIARIFG